MDYKEFKKYAKEQCKANGITFVEKANLLYDDENSNSQCSGFFCSDTKRLAVSSTAPKADIFGVLVHEYCHMQQWIEDCDAWRSMNMNDKEMKKWATYDIDCLGTLLDYALEGSVSLTDKEFKRCVEAIIEVEYDCEIRTVKLIEELNLPIDVKMYSRKALAYIYFYQYMTVSKEWYPKDRKPPYAYKEIYSKFPADLTEFNVLAPITEEYVVAYTDALYN
jgi:hypothetical protein